MAIKKNRWYQIVKYHISNKMSQQVDHLGDYSLGLFPLTKKMHIIPVGEFEVSSSGIEKDDTGCLEPREIPHINIKQIRLYKQSIGFTFYLSFHF